MVPLTQPIRDEHRELLAHIENLRHIADYIEQGPLTVEMKDRLDAAWNFLNYTLIPHAQAEDAVLYPSVEQVMAAPHATATMSREHEEIAHLTHQLITIKNEIVYFSLAPEQASDLRRVLYGLYALIKVHLIKEEELYLPLLDSKLTPETAEDLFDRLEIAAADAKQHARSLALNDPVFLRFK
jgi:hemerythrin-like domain-containing protein